jgi:hypothetical protein
VKLSFKNKHLKAIAINASTAPSFSHRCRNPNRDGWPMNEFLPTGGGKVFKMKIRKYYRQKKINNEYPIKDN